jgi:hypothetical protein
VPYSYALSPTVKTDADGNRSRREAVASSPWLKQSAMSPAARTTGSVSGDGGGDGATLNVVATLRPTFPPASACWARAV